MMMLFVEEASCISYATTLASSGRFVAVNPVGIANDIPTLTRDVFGGGHGENVHDRPVRETEVPSGQTFASIGQATGCEGCSIAFLYTSPPIPATIISKIPIKNVLIFK